MLRAGIFVDTENASRTGGWSMQYQVLKAFAEAQGAQVLRANAYMAVDPDREDEDLVYAQRSRAFRGKIRELGFRVSLKEVKRYTNADGETVQKANSDLDLAIDAVVQARNLDYVVLVTGDGDFVRLVTALQDMGCRVDVVGFHNVSRDLRNIADNFISGFLIPGLLPTENGRRRGYIHVVQEGKFYGWLSTYPNLAVSSKTIDTFVHGNDVEGGRLHMDEFEALKSNYKILEYTPEADEQGRVKAREVRLLRLEGRSDNKVPAR